MNMRKKIRYNEDKSNAFDNKLEETFIQKNLTIEEYLGYIPIQENEKD